MYFYVINHFQIRFQLIICIQLFCKSLNSFRFPKLYFVSILSIRKNQMGHLTTISSLFCHEQVKKFLLNVFLLSSNNAYREIIGKTENFRMLRS